MSVVNSQDLHHYIEHICHLLRTGTIQNWFTARDLLQKLLIEARLYDQPAAHSLKVDDE